MSKLDLRSYQQEISERLAAARRAGEDVSRLGFTAGGVRYALPLTDVSEVAPVSGIRRVPGCAPWFLGITNIRGSVLALTHLGALLGAADVSVSSDSRVLVLGGQFARLRCGVLVDSVAGLRTIKSTELLEMPVLGSTLRGTDSDGGEWALLDVGKLVTVTPFFDVSVTQETVVASH